MPENIKQNYVDRCQQLLDLLDQVKGEGRTLIYLDEIMFTKRSVCLLEYSHKNTNLTVDQEEVYIGYRAAIATMTAERGILHVRI